MIQLSDTLRNQLPEAVIKKLSTFDPLTQEAFVTEFEKKKKSYGMGYFLWFIGFHYFYLGRFWMNIFFWITFCGFGFWWIIDLFRISGMIRDYNKTVAIIVLKEIQFLG